MQRDATPMHLAGVDVAALLGLSDLIGRGIVCKVEESRVRVRAAVNGRTRADVRTCASRGVGRGMRAVRGGARLRVYARACKIECH